MDLELIELAASISADLMNDRRFSEWGSDLREEHGIELSPGFFNIYNSHTGQSKMCIYNPETGFLYKNAYDCPSDWVSGSLVGEVEIDRFVYPVRLPEFHYFKRTGILAQEYIIGEVHDCKGTGAYACDHTVEMADATGYWDCHTGNWKIVGDEIVLFDFC